MTTSRLEYDLTIRITLALALFVRKVILNIVDETQNQQSIYYFYEHREL